MRRLSDDLFLAIAHPVRREILEALAEADSVPVADLQVRTGLSASALSQHLSVLRSAGLVQDEKQGRKVSYRLTPEPLLEVISWMLHFQETWSSRLDALGRYLDEGGLPQGDGPEKKRRQ